MSHRNQLHVSSKKAEIKQPIKKESPKESEFEALQAVMRLFVGGAMERADELICD